MKRSGDSTDDSTFVPFTLTSEEIDALPDRHPHGTLGFALLLKFLGIHGRFPSSPKEIPRPAVQHVARQLDVAPDCFGRYDWQSRTAERHRARIREMTGFRETAAGDMGELERWLRGHLDHHDETHPEEAAYEWLRELRIEPPTPERMQRLVRSVVRAHEQRLYGTVVAGLSQESRRLLDALLETAIETDEEAGNHWERSELAEILKGPGPVGLESVVAEVSKLERVRGLGLSDDLFDEIPPRMPRRCRRQVAVEPPRELRRHPDLLRYTLLAAACWVRGREITDNLADLLIRVVHQIGARAERRVAKEWLDDLIPVRGKDGILLSLAEAAVADPDGTVREILFPVVDEKTLRNLIRELKSAGPRFKIQVHTRMKGSYGHHYRKMLPKILAALEFRSNNEAHRPVIEALDLLRRYSDSRARLYAPDDEVPTVGIVPATWEALVYKETKNGRRIQRIAYEICVLEALRDRLRTKEIWIVGADRYRNPDLDLPADFSENRAHYYAVLGRPIEADRFISGLRSKMEWALAGFHRRLGSGAVGVKITKLGRFKIAKLKAKRPPPNMSAFRAEIAKRWPLTSLLDILKETDLRTSFTEVIRNTGPKERMSTETLRKRLLLCIYAQGTNLGIKRVVAGDHGVGYDKLLYVRRRYLDKDRLRNAVAHLVREILSIRQTPIWGEGTTACASDSKQFGAWDQNLMTEWHVRYGRPGVMIYWHVEENASCIYSQLKRCSSSEVASMIEGVLRHCTTMAVEKQYVDTHGQSEVGFAFCHLLGFRLLPRIKGVHRQKLYAPDVGGAESYPRLQAVLKRRSIDWELIRRQYDEMIKHAAALFMGTADAESILRRFTKDNLQHPTYRALSELGKAVKTIFLCEYLGSEELRREINKGLNLIETWNSVNDFIFFAKRGYFTTNRRDEQEISMLSLQLIQNCLVYVNTLMIQEVLATPDWSTRMTPEDLKALTPLLHAHVNPYGSFHLDMSKRLPIGL